MLKRIIESKRVRASGWGLLIAIIVAAGGGAVSDESADKVLEGLAYTIPTVFAGLIAGWRGGKQAEAAKLPPAEGGANHG